MIRRVVIGLVLVLVAGGAMYYWQYSIRRIPPTVEPTEAAQIVQGGVLPENIPTLYEPYYNSVAVSDSRISDESIGVAVSWSGVDRFYPLNILSQHEVVIDTFGEDTIMVTFSPLVYHPAAFLIEPEQRFNISGKLLNNITLLADETTESLWLQLNGQAIAGELTGSTLEQIPTWLSTWSIWRDNIPQGQVLSTYTGYDFDYTVDPYWDYYDSPNIDFPITLLDARLPAKTVITGVHSDSSEAIAWTAEYLESNSLFEADLSSQPILVMYDSERLSTRIFLRLVDNQELHFIYKENQLIDTDTGTVWNANGVASEGELTGKNLTELPTETAYWFAWFNTYPNGELAL